MLNSIKMVIKAKIENVVAAITLNKTIDLKELARTAKDLQYNPGKFPGAVYRIAEPKVAMLIFGSGKVICSGSRSNKDIEVAVKHLIAKLRKSGIRIKGKPLIEIQNIVASASIGFEVNLDVLAMEVMNTEYEPEQFPGLVFRLDKPKTVMLVFRSGKLIITGAKTPKDANLSAERTRRMIIKSNARI